MRLPALSLIQMPLFYMVDFYYAILLVVAFLYQQPRLPCYFTDRNFKYYIFLTICGVILYYINIYFGFLDIQKFIILILPAFGVYICCCFLPTHAAASLDMKVWCLQCYNCILGFLGLGTSYCLLVGMDVDTRAYFYCSNNILLQYLPVLKSLVVSTLWGGSIKLQNANAICIRFYFTF